MVQKYSTADLALIANQQVGKPYIMRFVDDITRRLRPWVGSQKLRRLVNSAGQGVPLNLSNRDLRYLTKEIDVIMRTVNPITVASHLEDASYSIKPKFNSLQVVGGHSSGKKSNVMTRNGSTLGAASAIKAIVSPTPTSVKQLANAYNLSNWLSNVSRESVLYPNLAKVVADSNTIKRLMAVEGGLRGGSVNPTVTNGSYHGPFQFGVSAWNEGVRLCRNPLISRAKDKFLFRNNMQLKASLSDTQGISPSNPNIMIPIACAYWEANLDYAKRCLGSSRFQSMIKKNPMGLLYLGHNIGRSFYQSPFVAGRISAGGHTYVWRGTKEGHRNLAYEQAVNRYLKLQSGEAQKIVKEAIFDMYNYRL